MTMYNITDIYTVQNVSLHLEHTKGRILVYSQYSSAYYFFQVFFMVKFTEKFDTVCVYMNITNFQIMNEIKICFHALKRMHHI
jgi:hypothetical protein